jgi:glycosyltransferase involved in cell wall biosynthesis
MVSRGEAFPARFAIDCYRAQTYPNRELIIVCDRPDSELSRLVSSLGDRTIKYVETPRMVLGELRNASVAAASGSLLCQWDDDDLYHPRRIAYQVEALASTEAVAHFLDRWLLWWPKRRLLGVSKARGWEGSMLIRRDAIPRYPSMTKMEDAVLIEALVRDQLISMSDCPELYCYVNYGGNTWGDSHFRELFQEASLIYEDYDEALARVSADLPVKEYEIQSERAIPSGVESLSSTAREPFIVQDRVFGDESVSFDGVRYINCTFNRSTLVYFGGTVEYADCAFEDVKIRFEGASKNIFNTIQLLRQHGILGPI